MEKVKRERIKWGFCPDCGLNMRNPDVKYRHERGECGEYKLQNKNRS